MTEQLDNIEEFESKETGRRVPRGWQALFWGLILWGIFYVAAYTPAIGGWSQETAYTKSLNK